MITLSELAEAMPDSDRRVPAACVFPGVPHFSGATVVGTGGNVVAVSVRIDGVPLLIGLDDGTHSGDTYVVSSDYANRLDDSEEGGAATVEDVIAAAESFALRLVWTDQENRPRVPVFGFAPVRDRADDWSSSDVIARQECAQCGHRLYSDHMSGALRSHRTERIACTAVGLSYRHVPTASYWQTVSSLT